MQKLKLLAGIILTALFLFPAFCTAQTVSIIGGNGQLVCPDCVGISQRYAPLMVQVNDSTGKPVPNTTVTWTSTQLGFTPVTSTSSTNSAGQATYTFLPFGFFFGITDFLPATVVASALGASASFVETTGEPNQLSGQVPVVINLIPAASAPALVGSAGQTAATPIKVLVAGFLAPIPGVQVALKSGTTGPTVSCATQPGQQPGTVLTDSTGTASCMPVFGSKLGVGSYSILVGGAFETFGPTTLTVNGGPPAILKIESGNNQTVNAGLKAPTALTALVTDLGGNPSTGAVVKWSVTEGSAVLSSVVSTSPSTGIVSAIVTPSAGPVQVTVALVSNITVQAVYAINVTTVVTALQKISGDNQQAAQNAPFVNPLIVQVNDNASPVAGAVVNFAVTSGSVTLDANSATSNAQGQAQVLATAGATAGPVVITATIKYGNTTYSEAFTLTVNPSGPTIVSVVNSAGFQNQFVSPCSLATIYGTNLAPGLQGVASAFIQPQTQVDGVTVSFGGFAAPILDVANVNGVESVSVQVPCEVPVPLPLTASQSTVPVVVTANGQASPSFVVSITTYSPGIFQFTDSADGQTRAVLVRPDGSFASASNPARRGEIIRMYVTGLGQTTPGLFTNEFDPLVTDPNGNPLAETLPVNANVVVGVNNGGVLVVSAKYAYGMVGVYEVEFQVPADTATGNNAPFAIAVYQGTALVFGNPSLIAIQ
jgi:uncharacterized protein (TIGR03437 family)